MTEKQLKRQHLLHGILFVALFACAAFYISGSSVMKYLSFSPLIIGIILGMFYGHTLKKHMPEEWLPGIKFCSKKLLRSAIILFGFKLTFHNIVEVGLNAVILDLIIVTGTLIIGIVLGKLLKIDRETTLLISTGSAICGAAAVLGMESVLNNKAYKTAIAVSAVVIFGTAAMFIYPLMFRAGFFHLTHQQWALFTGGTVHEVAHVVGASNPMGQTIAGDAIIVKMIRVIFLAPVLLLFAFIVSGKKEMNDDGTVAKSKIAIPWFAFGFLAVIGFNSLNLLPESVIQVIKYIDDFLLTMAMTALGMETHLRQFKESGVKPFILAAILFAGLLFGGYYIVKFIA
ncbi:MAG: YeiH family protein [Paludibacteraceae bacterium]